MKLIISRLPELRHGITVALEDENGTIQNQCIINGNTPSHKGAVALLGIDSHAVYGFSHPEIISRIIKEGPQILLSTKEYGHRLFEHGMKASTGKIKVENSYYIAMLESYYALRSQYKYMRIIAGKQGLGLLLEFPKKEPVLIAYNEFIPNDKIDCQTIYLETVSKYLCHPL